MSSDPKPTEKESTKPTKTTPSGELSDKQLSGIAGGSGAMAPAGFPDKGSGSDSQTQTP
ncbi:MAG: hypothetical protein U0794_17715 [Isosphaeraceae bacterium]